VPPQVAMVWQYPASLPPLCTDRRKLRQILDNLIGNAVKFTEQGTVTVAARAAEEELHASRDQVYLEFSVSDTGVGMPSDTLGNIFDKFYQIDSSETRSYGGVGMGLYIAKRFADLLGGQIAVESALGKGSTFSLRIPCKPATA
jgi:signal transduction histidine kinase